MYPTPSTSPDSSLTHRNGAARLARAHEAAGPHGEPGSPARSGTSPLIASPRGTPADARVDVFFSGKGGDGKTWACANAAALLARIADQRILIIDNDMNSGRQALHFDLNPTEQTLYYLAVDVAAARRLDEDLLRRRLMPITSIFETGATGPGRLDLLPGIRDITEATRPELAGQAGQRLLTEIVALASRLYDLVLIDSGSQPFLGAHAGALACADRILFMNSTDRTSLIPNRQVMESVLREFRLPKDRFTLVINRYNPADDINLNDVERLMGLPVSVQIHEDLSRMAISALNHGVPFAIDYLQRKSVRNKHSDATFRGLCDLCEEILPGFQATLKASSHLNSAWNPFNRK